jgi:hypothetical protein
MGKKLSKKQMRNAATKEAFRLAAAAQAEKKKKKLQQDYVPIKAANQQKQADALKVKGGCVVVIVVGDALCAVCCAALTCCVSDVLRDVLCGVPPDWPLVRSAPLLVFVDHC